MKQDSLLFGTNPLKLTKCTLSQSFNNGFWISICKAGTVNYIAYTVLQANLEHIH